MKIVLDTNSLIQSIPRQSRYYVVWESLVKGENVLCVSNEILEEYIEILQRLTDYETAELIVKTIINSPFVELVTPYYHFQMIQADPEDNKFVDCAIAANARYIVTNDRHYDVLRQTPFPYVDVIALADFAEMLGRCKQN
ncbi:MAG: putative toxin-antitoxin system toxin component, PIN family [Bacteroidaceae bacterium]|nr:putative toxin-antitoxin system toxin component, PIN family [Bacteroidaceae bacterium]